MFRDLLLNRNNIKRAIEFFCKCNYKHFEISEVTYERFTRYNIDFDGNNMFLDVFFNKRGGTTLQTHNGKNLEEKQKLAKYISESDLCKCGIDSKLNRTMVFKKVLLEDFETVLKIIFEDEYYLATIFKCDNENNIIVKLEGCWEDKVTLTFYKTTNTVMLQGRPLALFSTISSLFNELIDIDNMVESLYGTYQIDISPESIEEQYIALLPNSHEKHPCKLKKSLLKSIYNLNVPKQPYTCTELVFEVLRALEGHIKLTLSTIYNVRVSNAYGSLYMFTYDDNTRMVSISSDVIKKISNTEKVEYYKEAYKYYKEYRHKIFHWDFPEDIALDSTEQLEDIEDAKNIIRDTLKLIDKFYC